MDCVKAMVFANVMMDLKERVVIRLCAKIIVVIKDCVIKEDAIV